MPLDTLYLILYTFTMSKNSIFTAIAVLVVAFFVLSSIPQTKNWPVIGGFFSQRGLIIVDKPKPGDIVGADRVIRITGKSKGLGGTIFTEIQNEKGERVDWAIMWVKNELEDSKGYGPFDMEWILAINDEIEKEATRTGGKKLFLEIYGRNDDINPKGRSGRVIIPFIYTGGFVEK